MSYHNYDKLFAPILQANSNAYEWLISKIVSLNAIDDPEAVLSQSVSAAGFAAQFHVGRFADGTLENVGLEMGCNLIESKSKAGHFLRFNARENCRRHILHVTRLVDRVGGHTRMLYHWLRNDRSSCHSVVLLDQFEPIPRWFSEGVLSGGGSLVQLPKNLSLCKKASELIAIARQGVDLVVLHHFPDDIIPTTAFAGNECPPVAVLNHADHTFWLGSSVADIVINLRAAGADHTARRRFVSRNTVLPIPLLDQPRRISRANARKALGIPENQVILLSIGREQKYRPNGYFDFMATVAKLLDHEKSAHLYVVGASPAGIKPFLRAPIHDRLHFVGSLEDPSLYRDVADVYLESFPFGSTTALLEAALRGLPIVPSYGPLFPLLVGSTESISDLLPSPSSEQDYINRALSLIGAPDEREELGQTLRSRVLAHHVGEAWLDRLDALYNETDRLEHASRPIPSTSCLFSSEDIGLSMWNMFLDGQPLRGNGEPDQRRTVLLHATFVAKRVGQFAKARRFAWRAVRENPCRLTPWLLLIKAMLGRYSPTIGRVLHNFNMQVLAFFKISTFR